MRTLLTMALVVALAASVSAYDLGNQAPAKPVVPYPENVPNPGRQGGDTIATATVIPALPYYDTGTTAGYTDDYSGSCYYAGGAPDVVYKYVPTTNMVLDIDLCGSTYDTGLYVYDSDLNEIACNDDFCDLQSTVHSVPLVAGSTYYIIVDGYGSAFGTYQVVIACCPPPCTLDCPTGGIAEGEPPLVSDYVDNWNGGCDTPGEYFEQVWGDYPNGTKTLCGVSGWYLYNGSNYRDTDWYLLEMGSGGQIDVTMDAEYASYIYELGGTCAGGVTVIQQAVGGPCLETHMTITGYSELQAVWFWVGPTVFAPPSGYPPQSYNYVCWFDGLFAWWIPTGVDDEHATRKSATWSTVKALFE